MHREILDFHLENLEVRTVYRAYVLGLHLCPYAWRGFGDVRRIHSPWRFGPLGRARPCMHAIWSTCVKALSYKVGIYSPQASERPAL